MDRQRLGLWGTLVFAALAAVGMGIQVYLIAGTLFGEDWLDAHKTFGKVTHGFYILTFLAALLAAWPNWRTTTWPFVLAFLGSIQAFLAFDGDVGGENGAIHAFHGALAPIVFVIAVWIVWRTYATLTPGRQTPSPT